MSTIFSPNRSKDITDDLEIELGGKYYPIRMHRPARAKSITLSADTVTGEVKLGLPRYSNVREALSFVQSKSEWLAARFSEAAPVVPIENGSTISYLGEEHMIKWSKEFQRKPHRQAGEIRVGGPEERISDRVLNWLKTEARKTYQIDLIKYCSAADCEVPQLSVGDARRRWGSCSGKQSIRLSWRLIMAPPFVRQSVVAHEVAHLRHMNHGEAFYDHLDVIFEGDRQSADRWLKQHGSNLHLIGASTR